MTAPTEAEVEAAANEVQREIPVPRKHAVIIARAALTAAAALRSPAAGEADEQLAYLLAVVEEHADKFPVPTHLRGLIAKVGAAHPPSTAAAFEEAAKICDEAAKAWPATSPSDHAVESALLNAAAAIRERAKDLTKPNK